MRRAAYSSWLFDVFAVSVAVVGCLVGAGCTRPPPDAPNVVLVTLDTTRADHLGCYGYDRPTSPNLDRLAAAGVRFARARGVSSWTLPTHASLFTGKYPSVHGARYHPEGRFRLSQGLDGRFAHYRVNPMHDGEATLAGWMGDAGWRTGGVVAGPWMKKVFGLDRGFGWWDDRNIRELNGRDAADVTDSAISFVERHADEPFLLFVNYFDPHGPWMTRWEFLERFDLGDDFGAVVEAFRKGTATPEQRTRVKNAFYDGEIAYADHHLGRLLAALGERGLTDRTWIVVTADHGELMGDPILGGVGLWGHGATLSEAELRIPLVVKAPAGVPGFEPGTVDDRLAQQVDVFPTLAAHLDIDPPDTAAMQGTALGAGTKAHPTFAEVYPLEEVSGGSGDWRTTGSWMVLLDETGRHKLGWNDRGRHFLVDLVEDPEERTDRAASRPAEVERLQAQLEAWTAGWPVRERSGGEVTLDSGTLELLEGLGYLGGSTSDEDEPAGRDPG